MGKKTLESSFLVVFVLTFSNTPSLSVSKYAEFVFLAGLAGSEHHLQARYRAVPRGMPEFKIPVLLKNPFLSRGDLQSLSMSLQCVI